MEERDNPNVKTTKPTQNEYKTKKNKTKIKQKKITSNLTQNQNKIENNKTKIKKTPNKSTQNDDKTTKPR